MKPGLRYIKQECLDACIAEYLRLGNPLDGVALSPEDAVSQVIQYLNATGEGAAAGEQQTEGTGESEGDEEPGPETTFTVNLVEGTWFLFGFRNGEQVGSASLPDPSDGLGFYQVVVEDGNVYAWSGGEAVAIPCSEYLAQNASQSLAPGVAGRHP